MRERRAQRRQFALSYLGGACVVCGTDQNLEFDHIDPSTKEMTISSSRALDGPIDRMVSELKKCQLLCKDHHLEKSRASGDLKGGHNKIADRVCGTQVKYSDGCRCDKCKEWKRLYRKKLVGPSGLAL